MSIGERIRLKRKQKGMTLEELSCFVGVSRQTLSRYENNIIAVPSDRMELIAAALGTTPAYLMGWDADGLSCENEIAENAKAHRIPVYGKVAAGIPLEMVEDILDYEEIPAKWGDPSDFFCLQIKGKSMQPKMDEGDVVVVKKQADADSNDIVIFAVNGENASCKRLKKSEHGLAFIPLNTDYDPMIYSWEQVEELPVQILGRVVELRAKF